MDGTGLLHRAVRRIRNRAGYGLALLPVLTDWIDTGHWPEHLRELSTELIIGVLIWFGIHQLYRRTDRFRRLSETDPLTGLGNRARFRSDLDAAVARARRTRRPLALAFIDVDGFKQINDALGHDAGDVLLQELGRALTRSVRQGQDGCYRPGGDEFAVLITGANAERALEALRRGFARAVSTSGTVVTCSVGVVTCREGESAEALVRRADALMYAAKRGEDSSGDGPGTLLGHLTIEPAAPQMLARHG